MLVDIVFVQNNALDSRQMGQILARAVLLLPACVESINMVLLNETFGNVLSGRSSFIKNSQIHCKMGFIRWTEL